MTTTEKTPTKTRGKRSTPPAAPAEAASLPVPVVDDIDFMLQDSGRGIEGADASCFAVPFLSILQTQSPALETYPNLRPGMFFDSVRAAGLSAPVQAIHCAFQRRWLAFKPRKEGGGLVGVYTPSDIDVHADVDWSDPLRPMLRGAELRDVRAHFILYAAGGTDHADVSNWHPAAFNLSSTQIKKSKQWLAALASSRAKGKQLPTFGVVFDLTTAKEENSQGSWHGVTIRYQGLVKSRELYGEAKTFHERCVSGAVSANFEQHEGLATEEDENAF